MVSARFILLASAAVAAASFTGQEANAVQLRGPADTTIDADASVEADVDVDVDVDVDLETKPFTGGVGLTRPLKARFQAKTSDLRDTAKNTRKTVREGKKAVNLTLKDVQKVNNANSVDTRGVVMDGKRAINLALKDAKGVYKETTQAAEAAAIESEKAAIASRAAVVKGQEEMKLSMTEGKNAMAKLWATEEAANKRAAAAMAQEVARATQAAHDARVAADEGAKAMTGSLDEAKEANKEAAVTTTTSSKKGDMAMKVELSKARSANVQATQGNIAAVNEANKAMQAAMKFALRQALEYGRDSVSEVKKAAKEVIEHIEGHLASEAAAAAAALAKSKYKFKSLGCFKDGENRALGLARTNNASPDSCSTYCGARGFTHFGLQWRYQCFCGDEGWDQYGAVDDSSCDMPCTNMPEIMCGGGWANNVYEVLAEDISDDPIKETKSITTFEI